MGTDTNHVYPAISSGHECSYVDCWCDHRECELCGIEETSVMADEPCAGKDPWIVEAKRLLGLVGLSDETARKLAFGNIAGASRIRKHTPAMFVTNLRWLYSNMKTEDKVFKAIDDDASTAIRLLVERGYMDAG